MSHLFVDISSHGFGHLAQVAPVLNALAAARPDLRLTLRSGLPRERLASRIAAAFSHIREASDFGFVMTNALDIDLPASAARYREFHADWDGRVRREADFLAELAPESVFSDVAYLPLAGAAAAGIPAVALCSLNWADLLAHYFHADPTLRSVHAQAFAAYASARAFLRATPGMPMLDLQNVVVTGPVAELRQPDRAALAEQFGLPEEKRWVLVALGGFDFPLPVAAWPRRDDVLWLEPAAGMPFADLLAAADAVITKPGYGTFVEAAAHGVPVLYLRRPDWPEEAPLVEWLHAHARAAEIGRRQAMDGQFLPVLDRLWARPAHAKPEPTGVIHARDHLLRILESKR